MSASSTPSQIEPQMAVGPLLAMPVEMVLEICEHLGPKDLSSLMKSCQALYFILAPQLFHEFCFRGVPGTANQHLRQFIAKPAGHFGCQYYREYARALSMNFLLDDCHGYGYGASKDSDFSSNIVRAVGLASNLRYLSLNTGYLDGCGIGGPERLQALAERNQVKSSGAQSLPRTQPLVRRIMGAAPNIIALGLGPGANSMFFDAHQPSSSRVDNDKPEELENIKKLAISLDQIAIDLPDLTFALTPLAINMVGSKFPWLDCLSLVDGEPKCWDDDLMPTMNEIARHRQLILNALQGAGMESLTHFAFPLNRDVAFRDNILTANNWESRPVGPFSREEVMRNFQAIYGSLLSAIVGTGLPLRNICIVDGCQYWQVKHDGVLSEQRLQPELLDMSDVPEGCWPKGCKDLV